MKKENNRLYILIRSDLPSMSPGRAMAQASHAANAFIAKFGHRKDVKLWQKETTQGFGTAIVLSASLPQITEIVCGLKEPNELVVDPEYGVRTDKEMLHLIDRTKILDNKTIVNDDGTVVIFKEVITCAYVFGSKDGLEPILGHLKLHS